jgi:hypothetical protein
MLDSVLQDMRKYEYDRQPPCGKQERENLYAAVQKELGAALPREYLELLEVVNGLDYDGLVIFASKRGPYVDDPATDLEGIIEANSDYRDNPDMSDYLLFGEDGTVFYAQDLRSGRFVVCLTVGLTELESYPTCSELFVSAFKSHLECGPEGESPAKGDEV